MRKGFIEDEASKINNFAVEPMMYVQESSEGSIGKKLSNPIMMLGLVAIVLVALGALSLVF
ncbi:MAG: high light inducible protein [Synechococcaceae cyanobacterium RL_1_2]|nr:high light inducible protein [Synechococcaceae cyanobacterium RL_1_2]